MLNFLSVSFLFYKMVSYVMLQERLCNKGPALCLEHGSCPITVMVFVAEVMIIVETSPWLSFFLSTQQAFPVLKTTVPFLWVNAPQFYVVLDEVSIRVPHPSTIAMGF